jgi:hypothetical protein
MMTSAAPLPGTMLSEVTALARAAGTCGRAPRALSALHAPTPNATTAAATSVPIRLIEFLTGEVAVYQREPTSRRG